MIRMMEGRIIKRSYALRFCKCKNRFWKNDVHQPCKFRTSLNSGE